MRTKTLLACLVGILVFLSSTSSAPARTSSSSTIISGAIGRKPDGTKFTVTISLLSDEDRTYVKQQPRNGAPPGQIPGPGPRLAAAPSTPPQLGPNAARIAPPGALVHRGLPDPDETTRFDGCKRDKYGKLLWVHVDIDLPKLKHHYAFYVTHDVIALDIDQQVALFDKQLNFGDDARYVKQALWNIKNKMGVTRIYH